MSTTFSHEPAVSSSLIPITAGFQCIPFGTELQENDTFSLFLRNKDKDMENDHNDSQETSSAFPPPVRPHIQTHFEYHFA